MVIQLKVLDGIIEPNFPTLNCAEFSNVDNTVLKHLMLHKIKKNKNH